MRGSLLSSLLLAWLFLISILPGGSSEKQTKNGPFGPDDDVVISLNTAWPEGTYRARSLLITSGATLTIAGGSSVTVSETVVVTGNSTILCQGKNTGAKVNNRWVGTGVTIEARDFTLDTGCKISADAQGYNNQCGPGAGTESTYDGGGGSHGGYGGSRGWGTGGRVLYGSPFQPVDLGSGGGNAYASTGGRGGGAIHLSITGILTLNGEISARGGTPTGAAGGGAGGSLLVTCQTLTGSGRFVADGTPRADNWVGGSGGRIAVYYGDGSGFSGFATSQASGGGNDGEPGTVGFFDTSVPNNALSVWQKFWIPQDTDVVLGNLTLHPFASFVMEGGSLLWLDGGLTMSETAILTARCKNISGKVNDAWSGTGVDICGRNIWIDATSRLTADTQGYPGGNAGNGTGPAAGEYSSGGTHGGTGAAGSQGWPIVNTLVYGDPTAPITPGSGGGGYDALGGGTGGAGGGAIRLHAHETLTLDGEITASGENKNTGRGDGAGAGGSVFLSAGTMTGSGHVRADGGSSLSGRGGGGGGGRIAFYYHDPALTFPLDHLTTIPGTGGSPAATAGSLVINRSSLFEWVRPSDSLCHDTELLAWRALAVDFNGTTADIALYAAGSLVSSLGTGLPAAGTMNWNSRSVADGAYELRATFRNGTSGIIGSASRNILVNNAALWHSGTMYSSETWTAETVHIVEGNISISSGATLTLQAGTVVKFVSGRNLSITIENGGILTDEATSDSHVVFTSLNDDTVGGDSNFDGGLVPPVPGDWYGITINAGGQCNLSAWSEIRYIRTTHSGTIAASQTWSGWALHYITGGVTIPSGVTVTIEPGAIIKFDRYLGITVLAGGSLVANGTKSQPISFTSSRDDAKGGDTNGDGNQTVPSAGDWRWIYIEGQAAFEHCRFRYGAGTSSGSWDGTGVIRTASTASLTVSRCLVQEALFDGILVWGGTADISNSILTGLGRAICAHSGTANITNCTVDDNPVGLLLHGGTLNVANTIVSNSTTAGILHDSGPDTITIRYSNVWNPSATSGNYSGTADRTGTSGNISANPVYKRPEHQNYQLNYGSPCIDAADNTAAETDFAGMGRYDDPRTPDTGVPMPGGACADMGAYEFIETAASDVDLAILWVTGPTSAVAGETVHISWVVANLGTGYAVGPWHDAVFLSYRGYDIFAGEVLVGEGVILAPGEIQEFSTEIVVPGSITGEHQWSVATNVYGEVFEGANAANNQTSSVASVTLDVPEIIVNGPAATGQFTAAGQSLWFRFTPAAGQDILVSLDLTGSGATEMYLSRNRMPTRQSYEIRQKENNSPDVGALVPDTTAETYYVLVYARTLPSSPANFTISAVSQDLSLTSISPTSAANLNTTTFTLQGCRLNAGLTYELIDPNGTPYAAQSVLVVNSSQVCATFNLTGLPVGQYDVRVTDGGQSVMLEDALTVQAAGVTPRTSRDTLQITMQCPEFVRPGREVRIVINYRNTGEADLTLPMITVKARNGGILRFLPGMTAPADPTRLTFLAPCVQPRLPILPPGAAGSVTIYYTVPQQVGTCQLDVYAETFDNQDFASHPIDWNMVSAAIRPAGVSDEVWDAEMTAQRARYGETYGAFFQSLTAQMGMMDRPTGWPEMVFVEGRWFFPINLLENPTDLVVRPQIEPSGGKTAEKTFSSLLDQMFPLTKKISTPGIKKIYVVIIGANDYRVSGYSNLVGCVPDANKMRALMTKTYDLPPEDVTCLTDEVGDDKDNLDSNKVKQTIHDALQKADEDDLVVVYNSSHGLKVEYGTSTFNPNLVYNDTSQVFYSDLNQEFSACAGQVLFISDSCYSNYIAMGITASNTVAVGSGWMPVVDTDTGGAYFTILLQEILADPHGNILDALERAKKRWQKIKTPFPHPWEYNDSHINTHGISEIRLDSPGTADTKKPVSNYLIADTLMEGPVRCRGVMKAVVPEDPNIKVRVGYGEEGFVPSAAALVYSIHFENKSTATAPAQRVVVSDQLSGNLDWSTVQFLDISFNDAWLAVPSGVKHDRMTTTVSTDPYPVEVQVEFDDNTGILTWIMQSVDPATKTLPEDPLAGFLPPNDDEHHGEGCVSFLVWPKTTLVSGDIILNEATIWFDENAPISTATVTNTIDDGKPASTVFPLPAAVNRNNFTVNWLGADAPGAGIAFYDVYVSTDGAAFTLWLGGVTDTSASFTGANGHTYAFFSLAQDNVGNREEIPLIADTWTLVLTGDLNADSVTDAVDIILCLRMALGLMPANNLADMNQDTVVNILDVIRVLRACLDL
ncbi:MAG: caspase family protein [Candidatus Omnitrophica bacterium]|nr:caspase family protein [Candidatus Omnitrophota bacterium]